MLQIKELEEFNICPCGIITDQALVWGYKENNHYQVICKTCQKELLTSIKK